MASIRTRASRLEMRPRRPAITSSASRARRAHRRIRMERTVQSLFFMNLRAIHHAALPFVLSLASLQGCAAADGTDPAMDEAAIERGATFRSSVTQKFDASKGELPEGIAIRGNNAYVGFAPTGSIARIDLRTGEKVPYAQLPAPVPNKGFMTGLAIDSKGTLYAALVSFTSEVQAGIYRVPAGGGDAVLFAKDANMPFPNGLAFDENDTLYATDSGTGSVFRISKSGAVVKWAQGPELSGATDFCGRGQGAGFDIGANGIVVEKDAVYVVNTDRATLVKIAKTKGTPTPEVIVGSDCGNLAGADGLTRDEKGNFIVAVNRQDKVVRISKDNQVSEVAKGLDFPASFAWSGKTLYATNFAFVRASRGESPAPGLVKFTTSSKE